MAELQPQTPNISFTKIADISEGMKGVNVRGKKIAEKMKENLKKNGEPLPPLQKYTIKDETGSIELQEWNWRESMFEVLFDVGDIIEGTDLEVKKNTFRGEDRPYLTRLKTGKVKKIGLSKEADDDKQTPET